MSEEKELTEQEKENAEKRARLLKEAEDERRQMEACLEAMKEGRGRMALEKPILAGGKELTALDYDFTKLTGLDLTEAMDSGSGAQYSLSGMSWRQGLALFARAAARETAGLDMKDIVERMGATDAAEAVELAGIFFAACLRAGRKRISTRP